MGTTCGWGCGLGGAGLNKLPRALCGSVLGKPMDCQFWILKRSTCGLFARGVNSSTADLMPLALDIRVASVNSFGRSRIVVL